MSETTSASTPRTRLVQTYDRVRQDSEALAAPLSHEAQTIQSMEDASPVKWHLAHTSWLYETFLLKPFFTGYEAFDESYEYLFNSYYNAVGEQYPRDKRGLITKPGVDEVLDYRAHVDRAMRHMIGDVSDNTYPRIQKLVRLGVNHEQQHQELLCTDLKHGLSFDPSQPAAYAAPAPALDDGAPSLAWVKYDGGLIETGVNWELEEFAFDNEGPRHKTWAEPFRLANRLITNAEYLEFMEDGGYTTSSLWLSDGWALVKKGKWCSPLYWEKSDGAWFEFTLHGRQELNPHAPVTHISFYEAAAYAAWADKRLLREDEWEIAAAAQEIDGQFLDPGTSPHPSVVNGSKAPLRQMFGDCWEWTQSSYSPYPGYRTPPGAVGEYNGKFMSNQMVLRGGSCATPSGHVRASYRNFFYPHQRWQFSGIRLAEDA